MDYAIRRKVNRNCTNIKHGEINLSNMDPKNVYLSVKVRQWKSKKYFIGRNKSVR